MYASIGLKAAASRPTYKNQKQEVPGRGQLELFEQPEQIM
jgi:hypothetical protein